MDAPMATPTDRDPGRSGAHDPYTGTLWTEVVNGAASSDPARREASWARFMAQYRRPIECTLRARLRVPALQAHTADLVNEFFSYLVLHRVLENADRSVGPFRRYLQGVVRNFVLELVREHGRWTTAEEAALATLAQEHDDVAAADEQEWFTGLVQSGLDTLALTNPRQARALRLRYGIAPEADRATMPPVIAAQMGATPHAIHELLRRGKRELRKILARDLAGTVYAASTDAYHDAFVAERAHAESMVAALWPGILDEAADD